MKRVLTAMASLLAVIGIMSGVTACSTTEKVDMSNVTAVIDVRTPDEFAEGHLEGSINIDYQSGNFASLVSELDTAGTYVLYCRSGNRAGQALADMQAMGFENLTNAGSVADASAATGIPIVK